MQFPKGFGRRKYGNKKTLVDNILFDSKKEAERYCQLKAMQQNGDISNLELQPRYDLRINGKFCGFYKADFRYVDSRDGRTVVEDVKGKKTAAYSLKKKLVEALHGIKITEI